ncbi:MAG: ATP-binding protein [Prevotella sp.]|nr:ATP-binding protein [Prevotella sp.]MBR1556821.1 ATP-binding protein [Prevotella sp.]
MEQKQDILIGRDAELKHLEAIASSKEAEFVVVYGRRRVGKTFLVNTFFGDKYTFRQQKSKHRLILSSNVLTRLSMFVR